MVLGARNAGFRKLIVPQLAMPMKPSLVDGIELYAVDSLQAPSAVISVTVRNGGDARAPALDPGDAHTHGGLSDVRRQPAAKRALGMAEPADTTASSSGRPAAAKPCSRGCCRQFFRRCARRGARGHEDLQRRRRYESGGRRHARPFRFPHHTISQTALVGGGPFVKPGEIALAHHGVLFLDEMPEFARGARGDASTTGGEGRVTVARAAGTFTYPARFQLVAR